jgi:hypothetical protein
MNTLELLLVLTLAGTTQSSFAQTPSKEIVDKLEAQNQSALQRYAIETGKPVPPVVDYNYGMKMDIAKTIHVSPPVRVCGNVKKFISYQDSKGELHSFRYTEQGDCPRKH